MIKKILKALSYIIGFVLFSSFILFVFTVGATWLLDLF
jgi:hypothetical protein